MLTTFLFAFAIALIAYRYPHSFEGWIGRLETAISTFARHRHAPLALALWILMLDALLAAMFVLPQPRIHDEFSYLLSADTFAHGRLTNPPHPLWNHFESFHIIMQPTYNSKYPPMPGLFMAVGQLAGNPIYGVWLSTALAVVALFWMLNALFSREWSLVGACLAVLNEQVLEWNWGYWGGTIPLLGGALLLGGFWRNLKAPAVVPSAVMGVGAGILALSRPFEGAVICLFTGLVLFGAYVKNRPGWGATIKQLVMPLIVAVLPFLAFDGYYNYRVTGNALTMPYVVYENRYSRKSLFVFGSDRPTVPEYHNEMMRAFYKTHEEIADRQKTLRGYAGEVWTKLGHFEQYFWGGLGVACLLPLIAVARRNASCQIACGLFFAPFIISVGLAVYTLPHYTAPYFPALLMALVFSLREMYGWSRGAGRWGRLAVQLLCVTICGLNLKLFADNWRAKDKQKEWQYARAQLVDSLERNGKKNLVIVQYGPGHSPNWEWVYNRADIDAARVVWARDLGEEENRKLLDYFKGYQVYSIQFDDQKLLLDTYPKKTKKQSPPAAGH